MSARYCEATNSRATIGGLRNTALDKYAGTLVFVSHDREFVSSLATRIIELRPGKKPGDPAIVVDFQGSYDDFLAGAGAEMAAA